MGVLFSAERTLSAEKTLPGTVLYALQERLRRAAMTDPSTHSEGDNPRSEQFKSTQLDGDEVEAPEDVPGKHQIDLIGAFDSFDQAIRAVIELAHASNDAPSSPSRTADAQAPPMVPTQGESGTWPSPPLEFGVHQQPELISAPPPPIRQPRPLRQLTQLTLVIVFAASVAYVLTITSTSQPGALQPKGASERPAQMASQANEVQTISAAPSRLIVKNQEVFANEPLRLALSVEQPANNESLLLDGLSPGTTLSAGAPMNRFSWRVASDELHGLYLYAPKDFVGVMNTTANLLSDRQLIDSQGMQLKWVSSIRKPPVAVAKRTPSTSEPVAVITSSVPKIRPIDPGEAALLMRKGQDFLGVGDLSAARIAFRRLADAHIADAALALAKTYDPEYLATHNFLGVRGDQATAQAWYRRAKELGSVEADRFLAHTVAK
jgi:hypothetical protein